MPATPKADFWFSLPLSAFGLAVVAESLRMPRLEHLGVHPMSAPGMTPGVLGLILALLGVTLLLRSLRARRLQTPEAASEPGPAAAGWDRLAITLGLCLFYAVGLLGWLPFWLATGLFVFGFVLVFTWAEAPVWRVALVAAVLAIAVSAAVTLLFEQVFLVRLP